MSEPWLTVITVVKDDVDGLLASAASLATQDRSGVEHLVIDGSTDREAVPRALAEAGIAPSVAVAWTEPRGIYEAMNDGLARAGGTYAHFLNAGDRFAGPQVLTRVRRALGGATWAFGDVAITDRAGQRVVPPPMDYEAERRASFARGRFPGHQGTFATVAALRGIGGFDTSYRIAADYAAFLRLSLLADPVILPFTVAEFTEGGASTQQWRRSFAEFHRARREILRPTGTAALREQAERLRHLAAVAIYRGIVEPRKRR